MSIIYRTDDMSKWGFGKGSDLDAVEIDLNFWDLDLRIATMEAAGIGKQLDYIAESNGALFVHYTDHTIDGPFPIPTATFIWRGIWQPNRQYNLYDIIYSGTGIYLIIFAHLSAATFDPGANDGQGHSYYQLMLLFPAIPVIEITTSTLTLTLDHANSYLRFTNPGGCSVFLSPQSTTAWVPFTEFHLRDETTQPSGGVQVQEISPANINPVSARLFQTAVPGATAFLKNVAVDSWDIGGHLAVG